jgi:hypothetical protein
MSSTTLHEITECPGLYSDSCVTDESNCLVFLSLWGRDTALQEFIARLTLPTSEHGLDQFTLHCAEPYSRVPVLVPRVDRLEQRSTRAYRRTLFGSLVNYWLFDRRCIEPDKANSFAFCIYPRESRDEDARLWWLVKDTCPLPLLDHWQGVVLALLKKRGMLTPFPTCIGHLSGFRIGIDVATLTTDLGELIRNGELSIFDSSSRTVSYPNARAA